MSPSEACPRSSEGVCASSQVRQSGARVLYTLSPSSTSCTCSTMEQSTPPPAAPTRGQRGQRRVNPQEGLTSSTVDTLLSQLSKCLGGGYGPNGHLVTLGKALVYVWAEPFLVYTRTHRHLAAYRKTRDSYGADLIELCQSVYNTLRGQQDPTYKLRQVTETLVSWAENLQKHHVHGADCETHSALHIGCSLEHMAQKYVCLWKERCALHHGSLCRSPPGHINLTVALAVVAKFWGCQRSCTSSHKLCSRHHEDQQPGNPYRAIHCATKEARMQHLQDLAKEAVRLDFSQSVGL